MQTDQVVYVFFEETGAWNGSYSDISYHPFAEFQISKSMELRKFQKFCNIDQYKISSLWDIMFQSDTVQSAEKMISFFGINF